MFGFNQKQQGILHLTWIAFFLTFLSWFNLAPFNTTLINVLGLSQDQINLLMISNVALTIPARIVIGSLVDHHGPRRMFSALLIFAGSVSIYFALADSFHELILARLLMGIVGAGFVVGIKMIGEWFPEERMGVAQGIYAGWGNFGAAGAALSLPLIASFFPMETGWRIATGFSGILCLIWACVYATFARENVEQGTRFKTGLQHSVEVTSKRDLILQCLLLIPVYGAFGLFLWKMTSADAAILHPSLFTVLLLLTVALYFWNIRVVYRNNISHITSSQKPADAYPFKQVVILSLVYALTFGSELSMVSMLPQFLQTTFGLTVTAAGMLGACYAGGNLITRPSGGWLSDRFGKKRMIFLLVLGAAVCYGFMGTITPDWPIAEVLLLCIACAFMIQAGNGACFSMVPLIRRDLTGKLAGIAGAYGNVGAVFFLTVLSWVGAQTYFFFIAGFALLVLVGISFLEPFKQEFKHTM